MGRLPELIDVWEVVAFGVGIGTIEALLVATSSNLLKGTALERSADQLDTTVASLSGGRRLLYAHILPVAERLIAAVIHVGTRGLVYVGYRSSSPLPVSMVLAAFILADGVIGYRLIYQGRLSDLGTLKRTYAGLFVIAVVVLTTFLLSWPDGGYHSAGPTRGLGGA